MTGPATSARRLARSLLAALVWLAPITAAGSACTAEAPPAPGCQALSRLGLVAQSVPSAGYVPCVGSLPPGWSVVSFDVRRGMAHFGLGSDRSPSHPVEVRLTAGCDTQGAEPTTSRAPGVQTYIRLDSIDPRYAGTLFDVFPGGCVSYRFDFQRGAHISLVQEFESAVSLLSRFHLRAELRTKLGLQLEP